MEYPASATPVQFIRLQLSQGDRMVSTNFYLPRVYGAERYQAIRGMPKAKLEAATQVERRGQAWRLTTELHNVSDVPALMVKIKAVRETTGDRILPVLYSDNYVALMPGERQAITTDVADADTRGEGPRIVIEGFNLQP
jgi:beta-mannosidase